MASWLILHTLPYVPHYTDLPGEKTNKKLAAAATYGSSEPISGPASACPESTKDATRDLTWLRRLRHHHAALEILDHLGFKPHFRRPLRQRHQVDLVLQLEECVEKPFRPRRTPDHIHIHRHNAIHALQHRIHVERPADARARPHRNTPLRVRHLVPYALQHRRHLQRHRPRHNHQIRLPRRGPEHLRPESRNIESRSRRRDHLDRAASQAKCQRPDRALARPVEYIVHRRQHIASFKPIVDYTHALFYPFLVPSKTREYTKPRVNDSKCLPICTTYTGTLYPPFTSLLYIFYRDLLGFKLIEDFRYENKPVYARLRAPGGDGTIALHQAGPEASVLSDGVRLYFEVRELDDFCRNLQKKGFYITQLPRMMPWGWRHAYLNDPDGHEISLYWAGENRMKKTVMKAAKQAEKQSPR